MTTLLLVLCLRSLSDSLAPPSILAPSSRRGDTIFVTSPNPLLGKQPYRPEDWTRIPPTLPKKNIKPVKLGLQIGLPFVAGALWALHETLQHHWGYFERKHPNANAQWWNPALSWKNKYRNSDPNEGRTCWPVQVTDAKHLLVLGHNATLFGAGVSIGLGKPRKWWRYAIDAGVSLLSYSAGNYLTYQFYKPP
jgi:hypothetical protein